MKFKRILSLVVGGIIVLLAVWLAKILLEESILIVGGIITRLAVLAKILQEHLILVVGGIMLLFAVFLAKILWDAMREARWKAEWDEGQARWKAERDEREARRKSTVEWELRALLEKHLKTLSLKKRQLTTTDAYGVKDNSKWTKHRSYFIDRVVLPQMHETPTSNEIYAFVRLIEDRTSAFIDIVCPSENYDEAMGAIQFEHFCAEIARRVGWDARVTQGSGDQGIDVIANNTTHKVVLQCKKYTSPVGIKAVQEVVAGKHFENADHAAVVSNAPFTPAARQLAASTGVALLHHSELEHYLRSLTRTSRAGQA